MTAVELVDRTGRAAAESDERLGAARNAARDSFRSRGGDDESLLWRALGWLGERLRDIFPDLAFGSSLSGLLSWLLLTALAAGLVYLVVRLVSALPGRGRAASRGSSLHREAPPFARARAEALRLASSNPREALRLLYTAVLAEVGRRRGWRPVPGRTNRGYIGLLGPSSPEGKALGEATRLFERSVYGDAPAGAADVERIDRLAERVLA